MQTSGPDEVKKSGMSPSLNVRVLIVAEHASSQFGGEAMLPLQYFRHLKQRGLDVTMVLHERCRGSMDAEFGRDCSDIHYVADSIINVLCNRIGSKLPKFIGDFSFGALSHLDTQIRQRRLVREIVRQKLIQVVHEPIPVSPKMPSLMHDVGAPVIIGPMNGGMDFPPAYRPRFDISGAFVRAVRLSANVMNRLMPGKRRAAVLLVANERTRVALPSSVFPERARLLVENAVDLGVFNAQQTATSAEPSATPRICYAGAVIPWKHVHLIVEACLALQFRSRDFILEIFGDGSCMAEVRALAAPLGDRAVFHGYVSQARLASGLRSADLLVLSSMRECGGAVVLEAMASGLPVVATNWGGPADYIDPTCGILLDPVAPLQFVPALADAIDSLLLDPACRREMGQAGIRRIETMFNWNKKIDYMVELYRETAGVSQHLL